MLPHRWHYANKENIADYARLAEELRYDHIWVTDHVAVPPVHQERGHIFYESLVTLTYAAAVTEKIRLGTCVLAALTRNPLLTAKQLCTLDRLSSGRIILGIGTGWIKEELDIFGVAYDRRLSYLREYIKLLHLVWNRSKKPLSFDGKWFRFHDMLIEPKPAQASIPILVGGNRGKSIEIARDLGDGWIPWAIGTDQIRNGRATIGDEKPIYLSGPVQLAPGTRQYRGSLGEEHSLLAGSNAEFAKQIEEYVEAGVEGFVLSFRDIRLFKDPNADLIFSQTRDFANEVMKSFK